KRAGGTKTVPKPQAEVVAPAKKRSRAAIPPNRVIAIGISTGGPNALQYLFSQIPGDFPATFVVVQHMPEGFTDMFARRLDECCALDVQEAKSGDLLVAGRVLVCPGNRHIMVRRMPRGDMVVLSDSPAINGHRPSADVLFHSVAQEFALSSVGVLMTGMGEDGAEGLGAIKAAGGHTIAQVSSLCAMVWPPAALIAPRPSAPSSPMPVMRTPTEESANSWATEWNSTSADGRWPLMAGLSDSTTISPRGMRRTMMWRLPGQTRTRPATSRSPDLAICSLLGAFSS